MSLTPISALGLTPEERLACLLRGWDALDPQTGAMLSRTDGRSRAGRAPRWVLIVPDQTPAARGGLFARYHWEDWGRAFLRAWTLEDALEQANRKLSEILKERVQTAGGELPGDASG